MVSTGNRWSLLECTSPCAETFFDFFRLLDFSVLEPASKLSRSSLSANQREAETSANVNKLLKRARVMTSLLMSVHQSTFRIDFFGARIKILETYLQALLPFPAARAPRRACLQVSKICFFSTRCMLLGYSFKPRPNSRCSHSVRAAETLKAEALLAE